MIKGIAEQDSLEARLRRTEKRKSYLAMNATAPIIEGEYDALINPDGPEAADTLSQMRDALDRCRLVIKFHCDPSKCVSRGDEVFSALDAHELAVGLLSGDARMMIDGRTRRLIIAARKVAFGDIGLPDDPDIRELDAASEAFAAEVPWDDGPATTTKIEKGRADG